MNRHHSPTGPAAANAKKAAKVDHSQLEKLSAHFGHYIQLLERPALHPVDSPFLKELCLKEVLEQVWDTQQLEEHLENLKQLTLARNMLECRILGVMGQLNAGKSTVVASFLSPEGRARVPRGVASAKGTHRFVYWVPQSWLDDSQMEKLLVDLLQSVHQGVPVEYLPQDPEEAEEAYRQGETSPKAFFTPLIAGDKGLDELGLAVLDCPDVVTPPMGTAWQKEKRQRWDFVVQASRLCSTILLVAEQSKLRERQLFDFLEQVHRRTKPVPLYLLVNKVHPRSSLREFAEDHYLRRALQLARGVYVAFDFNIPGWRSRLPRAIENVSRRWIPQYLEELWEKILGQWWDQEKIPVFFSLDRNDHQPQPSDWKELQNTERLLALPKQLDPGQYQQEKLISWRDRALEQISQVEHDLHHWQQEQLETARELRSKLWSFCVKLFTSRDSKTQQRVVQTPVSPKLIKAYDEALEETAPWYMFSYGIFRRIQRFLKKGRDILEIAKGLTRLKQSRWSKDKVKDRLNQSTAEELARELCDRRWVPSEIPEQEVTQAWEAVFKQLDKAWQNFPLDKELLRKLAKKQWENLPGWKKLLGGIVGTVAPVLGVLALVDGGATVLVWLGLVKAAGIATALPGGMLATIALVPGTLGVLLVPLANDAVMFCSTFFYLACDQFGLPRTMEGDEALREQVGSQALYLVEPQEIGLKPPLEPPRLWLHPRAGIYRMEETLQTFFQENRKLKESLC